MNKLLGAAIKAMDELRLANNPSVPSKERARIVRAYNALLEATANPDEEIDLTDKITPEQLRKEADSLAHDFAIKLADDDMSLVVCGGFQTAATLNIAQSLAQLVVITNEDDKRAKEQYSALIIADIVTKEVAQKMGNMFGCEQPIREDKLGVYDEFVKSHPSWLEKELNDGIEKSKAEDVKDWTEAYGGKGNLNTPEAKLSVWTKWIGPDIEPSEFLATMSEHTTDVNIEGEVDFLIETHLQKNGCENDGHPDYPQYEIDYVKATLIDMLAEAKNEAKREATSNGTN